MAQIPKGTTAVVMDVAAPLGGGVVLHSSLQPLTP